MRSISATIIVLAYALISSAGLCATAGGYSYIPYYEYVFAGKWGAVGSYIGQFRGVGGLALSSDGLIYVADRSNHRVQYFGPNGDYVGEWGTKGTGPGEFNVPWDVSVSPDGTVYVSDYLNHRVQFFTGDGKFLGSWGSEGSDPGEFKYPAGLAIGPDGRVFVADSKNRRVQYFTALGEFLGSWGTRDLGYRGMWFSYDVAAASNRDVYVCGSEYMIFRCSDSGSFKGSWGFPGSADEQLQYPSALAVGPSGVVFVVDTNNRRVQYFSPDGAFLGAFGSEGRADGEFVHPVAIAVAADGTVYVSDVRGHNIQYFKRVMSGEQEDK